VGDQAAIGDQLGSGLEVVVIGEPENLALRFSVKGGYQKVVAGC
jgi:hypothetical protein